MKKILLLTVMIMTGALIGAQTLQMGADDATKMYYPLVEEILNEAGLSSQLQVEPGGRSITKANEGELDGEIWRIISIQGGYPNLVPVPTPLRTLNFYAYYMVGGTVINSESELTGKKIGVIRGNKAAEGYMANLEAQAVYATSPENLLKLLESGRVDLVIADFAFRQRSENPSSIGQLGTPIITLPVHMWLNGKHSGLVPQIDGVIKSWGSAKLEEKIGSIVK
ncbi:MAG: transporter substrate-binding domain-containing protein [Spirochaetales bacterium]|nr:transporter substrate-binding domain-containing protein [Spirochaetales bacterium]